MSTAQRPESTESTGQVRGGALILLAYVVILIGMIFTMVTLGSRPDGDNFIAVFMLPTVLFAILVPIGFFVVQPNTSCVLVFFGKYRGTIREDGFYWTSPFMSKSKISLRANNVASETIKVNDLNGNPIEIGAVVVWSVRDTAKAKFDVEDYEDYVNVQIETAVRELAKTHPYESHRDEHGEHDTHEPAALRDGGDAVADELTAELQRRLDRAGIRVLEARISHLAYALEIASAMLQRQQAAAIISARRLIVEGAVGMVEEAIRGLETKGVVNFDDERKATMVSNLLVVLCSHVEPTPVINAGGIYS
jgi:regulator of protease activity HflC (stomatin/prohibitin superfamily)